MLRGRVPRGPLLPAQGHRGDGAAAARAARRNPDADRVLHRPLFARSTTGRCGRSPRNCAAVPRATTWPGNIRELENMIKRIVILQDEQLVVREIRQNMQRSAATAVAAASAVAVGAGAGFLPGGSPSAPAPEPMEIEDEPDAPADEPGESLAAIAKAASMKAERAAIEQTLRQVHWNRRKASVILGVSYKTLLNKNQGVRHQPGVDVRILRRSDDGETAALPRLPPPRHPVAGREPAIAKSNTGRGVSAAARAECASASTTAQVRVQVSGSARWPGSGSRPGPRGLVGLGRAQHDGASTPAID